MLPIAYPSVVFQNEDNTAQQIDGTASRRVAPLSRDNP